MSNTSALPPGIKTGTKSWEWSDPLATRRQIPQEEAAKFLGVSERMMEKMRRQGNGPKFVRLSRKLVRYRICDLFEYQEANLQKNNTGLDAA